MRCDGQLATPNPKSHDTPDSMQMSITGLPIYQNFIATYQLTGTLSHLFNFCLIFLILSGRL